jgi:hypothetical protein
MMRLFLGGGALSSNNRKKGMKGVTHTILALAVFGFFITGLFAGNGVQAQSVQTDEPSKNVLNLYGKPIGAVDENGVVYNLYGRTVGTVDEQGTVYNVSKINIGHVDADGKVYNQSGTHVFSVDEEGNVYNISGTKIGSVVGTGANLNLIGGAARLLF